VTEPSPSDAPAPDDPDQLDHDAPASDTEPVGSAPAERPDMGAMSPDDLESLTSQTLDQLDAVIAERDDYLDRLRRLQADFENYKKRSAKEHREAGERALARLADQLLPVLDSCDAALVHGASGVEPVFAALLGALEKEGLERIDPLDQPFDPELHEAVLHEHGDEGEGPSVVEVLRPGYAWKGKVIRAAMVKVKG
jgi:molecular chaperone GrpE